MVAGDGLSVGDGLSFCRFCDRSLFFDRRERDGSYPENVSDPKIAKRGRRLGSLVGSSVSLVGARAPGGREPTVGERQKTGDSGADGEKLTTMGKLPYYVSRHRNLLGRT